MATVNPTTLPTPKCEFYLSKAITQTVVTHRKQVGVCRRGVGRAGGVQKWVNVIKRHERSVIISPGV